MSDTPRTDLQMLVGKSQGHDGYVHAAFARVLEEELEVAKAEVARLGRRDSFDLQGINRIITDQTTAMSAEIAALRAPLKRVIDENDLEYPEHSITCTLKMDRATHPTMHRDTLLAAANIITTLRQDKERQLRALTQSRDTAIAILDSRKCYKADFTPRTVIDAEGPQRIKEACNTAIYPAVSP